MIQDVLVVDASAHSYNLREENYADGRYSQAVVDAFRFQSRVGEKFSNPSRHEFLRP